ncbi:MAG: type I-F CRISPR-associated protein Csy1 [Methylococcales bacterium]|nr:type I-F CRISPR-associated protein Csy1 [Methylococcales bacterium]
MLDPAIQSFLDERKAARLKGKIKPSLLEEERQLIIDNANEEFLLDNWLPKAAKRAWQVSLLSHPSKFTHSSAKTSPIIAVGSTKNDGFLRTGNSGTTALDVSGNAASLDVYRFLNLTLNDNQTILEHLEAETEHIKTQFSLSSASYQNIKEGLLAIKPIESDEKITSERVKQVYFPVDDHYHLLSLLTPSGLMYKFKQQINEIRFSDEVKEARGAKKKEAYHEKGFDELYNLTGIGFGGANPQGVSLLNSQNGGVSYLLLSTPPELIPQKIRLPKTDFFNNSLYYKNYASSFESLDKLMGLDRNNIHIRHGIDNIIRFIINQVIEQSWKIRSADKNWTEKTALKLFQKTWLDNAYEEKRAEDDDWVNEVMTELARWIINSYKKVVGDKKAKFLADTELVKIKALISEQQEGLL